MTRAQEILCMYEQLSEEGLIGKVVKWGKKIWKGAKESVPKPTGKGFTSMGGHGPGKDALRKALKLE